MVPQKRHSNNAVERVSAVAVFGNERALAVKYVLHNKTDPVGRRNSTGPHRRRKTRIFQRSPCARSSVDFRIDVYT